MDTMSLRRYTDLSALAYLLSGKKITLLNPNSWDDSNDSHYIDIYKNKQKLKTVLALCFSQSSQTYHHWRVFAPGSSGICIRFNKDQLLDVLNDHKGIRVGEVEYLTLKELRKRKPQLQELPFIKRAAFQDECEFRLVYESKIKLLNKLDIPIPLTCIDSIYLSPWINKNLSASVIKMLKSIKDCHNLEIIRSTLIGNEEWKNFAYKA